MLPGEWAKEKLAVTDKIGTEVLVGKNPPEKKPLDVMLELYESMPFFIPVYIMEEVVESVARKLPGSSGPGGMDSEALQGWLLKFGDNSKNICILC